MSRIVMVCTLCVLFFSSILHAASFDCHKASTYAEKTVCSDSELSRLDDELADSYKGALKNSSDPKSVRAQQRKWLNAERDICSDAECIKTAYTSRIAELAPGSGQGKQTVKTNQSVAPPVETKTTTSTSSSSYEEGDNVCVKIWENGRGFCGTIEQVTSKRYKVKIKDQNCGIYLCTSEDCLEGQGISGLLGTGLQVGDFVWTNKSCVTSK